jgi:hypothetical protein
MRSSYELPLASANRIRFERQKTGAITPQFKTTIFPCTGVVANVKKRNHCIKRNIYQQILIKKQK